MKRLKIFVLCVLPIALAFFIRYRYVTSPQYAFRSFTKVLEQKDIESLRRWTTKYSLKSLTVPDAEYPFAFRTGYQISDWSAWIRTSKKDPLYSAHQEWVFLSIKNRPFALVRCTSRFETVTFVFALVGEQWKMVQWNPSDTYDSNSQDEGMWNDSQKE